MAGISRASMDLGRTARSLEIRRLLAAAAKAREDALKRTERGYGPSESTLELLRSDSELSYDVENLPGSSRDRSNSPVQEDARKRINDDPCSDSDRSTDEKDVDDDDCKLKDNMRVQVAKEGIIDLTHQSSPDVQKYSGHLEDQLEKLLNLLSNDCAAREQLERQIERLQLELPAIAAASRKSDAGVEFLQKCSSPRENTFAELTELFGKLRENNEVLSQKDVLIASLKEELVSQGAIAAQLREQVLDLRRIADSVPQKDLAISRLTEEMKSLRDTFQTLIDEKDSKFALVLNEMELLQKTRDNTKNMSVFEAASHPIQLEGMIGHNSSGERAEIDPFACKIAELQNQLKTQKAIMDDFVAVSGQKESEMTKEIRILQDKIDIQNEKMSGINLVLEKSALIISSLDDISAALENRLAATTKSISNSRAFDSMLHIDFETKARSVLGRGDAEEIEQFLQESVDRLSKSKLKPDQLKVASYETKDLPYQNEQILGLLDQLHLQRQDSERIISEKSSVLAQCRKGLSRIWDLLAYQPSIESILEELALDMQSQCDSAAGDKEERCKVMLQLAVDQNHGVDVSIRSMGEMDADDSELRFVEEAKGALDRGDPEEIEIFLRDSIDLLQEQKKKMDLLRIESQRHDRSSRDFTMCEGVDQRLHNIVSDLQEQLQYQQKVAEDAVTEKNATLAHVARELNEIATDSSFDDLLTDLVLDIKHQQESTLQIAEQKRRFLIELESHTFEYAECTSFIEHAREVADRGDPEELESCLRHSIDLLDARCSGKAVSIESVKTLLEARSAIDGILHTQCRGAEVQHQPTEWQRNASDIKAFAARLNEQLLSDPSIESILNELRIGLMGGAVGVSPTLPAYETAFKPVADDNAAAREEGWLIVDEDLTDLILQSEGAAERGDPEEMEMFLRRCTERLHSLEVLQGSLTKSNAARQKMLENISLLTSELQVLRSEVTAKDATLEAMQSTTLEMEERLSAEAHGIDELDIVAADLDHLVRQVYVACECAESRNALALEEQQRLQALQEAHQAEELRAALDVEAKEQALAQAEQAFRAAAELRNELQGVQEMSSRALAECNEVLALRDAEIATLRAELQRAVAAGAEAAEPPGAGTPRSSGGLAIGAESVDPAAMERRETLVKEAEGALDRGDPEEMELALRACVEQLRSAGGPEGIHDTQWRERAKEAAVAERDEVLALRDAEIATLRAELQQRALAPAAEAAEPPRVGTPRSSGGLAIGAESVDPAAMERRETLVKEAEGALDRGDPEEMELALRACVEQLRLPEPARAVAAGPDDSHDAQWRERFRDACHQVRPTHPTSQFRCPPPHCLWPGPVLVIGLSPPSHPSRTSLSHPDHDDPLMPSARLLLSLHRSQSRASRAAGRARAGHGMRGGGVANLREPRMRPGPGSRPCPDRLAERGIRWPRPHP